MGELGWVLFKACLWIGFIVLQGLFWMLVAMGALFVLALKYAVIGVIWLIALIVELVRARRARKRVALMLGE